MSKFLAPSSALALTCDPPLAGLSGSAPRDRELRRSLPSSRRIARPEGKTLAWGPDDASIEE